MLQKDETRGSIYRVIGSRGHSLASFEFNFFLESVFCRDFTKTLFKKKRPKNKDLIWIFKIKPKPKLCVRMFIATNFVYIYMLKNTE